MFEFEAEGTFVHTRAGTKWGSARAVVGGCRDRVVVSHALKALSSASMRPKPARSATEAARSFPARVTLGDQLVDDDVEHGAGGEGEAPRGERCLRQAEGGQSGEE